MGKFTEWFNKNPQLITEAVMKKCPQCGSPNMGSDCVICGAKIPQVDNVTAAIDASRAGAKTGVRAAAPTTPSPQPPRPGNPSMAEALAKLRTIDLAGLFTPQKLIAHFGSKEIVDQLVKQKLLQINKHSPGYFTVFVPGRSSGPDPINGGGSNYQDNPNW